MQFYLIERWLKPAPDTKYNRMQNEQIKVRANKRLNDFPELQVGYPERNDVSNPNLEMERIHVDLETMGISKKSAAEISRELKRANVS